jgi:hypothetical protein
MMLVWKQSWRISQGGLSKLAAGDGNRVWYPEMIETLRSQWNESMTFPKLIELCASLDVMFQQRRPMGPSLPPGSRCPRCGRIVGGESFGRHRISVRAAILTLGRFEIASPALTKKIEKDWAKYRVQNGLDLYGYPSSALGQTPVDEANRPGCTHP